MATLERIPTGGELKAMIGEKAYSVWNEVCGLVDSLYDMEKQWNSGGKKWDYEYKFRRGGKTLCTLYAAESRFGLMIIFGRDEREKFELIRGSLSQGTVSEYDIAETYHDGKWVMFSESITMADLRIMLAIKRRSNKSR